MGQYQQNPVSFSSFTSIAEPCNSTLTAGAASFAGASSCQLSAGQNRLATVGVVGGGALMPPAQNIGQTITVYNAAATAAKLYGDNGDTINGTAGTTGVTLGAGCTAYLTCWATGVWAGPVAAV
jgi:hypothetical protein